MGNLTNFTNSFYLFDSPINICNLQKELSMLIFVHIEFKSSKMEFINILRTISTTLLHFNPYFDHIKDLNKTNIYPLIYTFNVKVYGIAYYEPLFYAKTRN